MSPPLSGPDLTTLSSARVPRAARRQDHCAEYGLSWSTGAEYVLRLQLFADASDMIEAHNAKPDVTYQLGHNKCATRRARHGGSPVVVCS